MKKFLAMLLALSMILSLAACGGNDAPAATPTDAPEAPVADAPAAHLAFSQGSRRSDLPKRQGRPRSHERV